MVEERLIQVEQLIEQACDNHVFACHNEEENRRYAAFEESESIWKHIEEFQSKGSFQAAYFYARLYLKLIAEERLTNEDDVDTGNSAEVASSREVMLINLLEILKDGMKRQIRFAGFNIDSMPLPTQVEREDKNIVPSTKPIVVDITDPQPITAEDEYYKLELAQWRKKVVSADGHCAFRSVAQGFANGILGREEETQTALEFRYSVCRLLRERRHEIVEPSGMTIEQLIMSDQLSRHITFDEYILGMQMSDYAGEMELMLLSRHLQRPIYIYIPNGVGYTRVFIYGEGEHPICIVWEKGFSEGTNHYNALIHLT